MPDIDVFAELLALETKKEALLKRIEDAINEIKIGSGSASIEDYAPDKFYRRNTLLVDPLTETVYRTIPKDGFTSTTLEQDRAAGRLKLVGFESQIVTLNHQPTQGEIDTLPEDALVAIYSPQDDPYTPALSTDNFEG